MAKSDSLFKDVFAILAFVVGGYFLLRLLPTFSQALSTASTGLFPSSTGQGALPYGFSLSTGPGGTRTQLSTSGTLGQLLSQLTGSKTQQQQQQQNASKSSPLASTSFGGGNPYAGLLPGGGPNGFTGLQDWVNAGNSNLAYNFAADPGSYSTAYYDTPTLDSIQIPTTPYTPQGIDLSGAAVPLGTPAIPSSYSSYDPSLDSISMDASGGYYSG